MEPVSFRKVPLGLAAGLELQIDLRRHKKLLLGLYEIEISHFVRRFARRGYNAFDVGGQSGYYALVFARMTRGHVISFDCDAACCAQMEEVFRRNARVGGTPSVLCKCVAAQSTPNTVSLDDVAFGGGGFVPDLIKMDVEGAEYDALVGAARILSERQPHLIVETHTADIHTRCQGLLADGGYRPVSIEPRWWLPDYRPAEFNRWLVAEGRW